MVINKTTKNKTVNKGCLKIKIVLYHFFHHQYHLNKNYYLNF